MKFQLSVVAVLFASAMVSISAQAQTRVSIVRDDPPEIILPAAPAQSVDISCKAVKNTSTDGATPDCQVQGSMMIREVQFGPDKMLIASFQKECPNSGGKFISAAFFGKRLDAGLLEVSSALAIYQDASDIGSYIHSASAISGQGVLLRANASFSLQAFNDGIISGSGSGLGCDLRLNLSN